MCPKEHLCEVKYAVKDWIFHFFTESGWGSATNYFVLSSFYSLIFSLNASCVKLWVERDDEKCRSWPGVDCQCLIMGSTSGNWQHLDLCWTFWSSIGLIFFNFSLCGTIMIFPPTSIYKEKNWGSGSWSWDKQRGRAIKIPPKI